MTKRAIWQSHTHFDAAQMLAVLERLEAEGRMPEPGRLYEFTRQARREYHAELARPSRRRTRSGRFSPAARRA